MSGNVPYCPSSAGIQILTGYDTSGTHNGTIYFNPSFKSGTIPFIFMQIFNPTNKPYTYFVTPGDISATYFEYEKRYNISSVASGENFSWLAIGESATVTTGNVPYYPGETGIQILTGYNAGGTQTGTVSFNTSYPWSSTPPNVYMSILGKNNSIFSLETRTVSTNDFTYAKHYNNDGSASGEEFYWIAIGKRAATGNVPVCPQLSGPKILYGTSTANTASETITFASAFTNIPTVLITIKHSSNNNYVYGVYTSNVTVNDFTYRKKYKENSDAYVEQIYWLAIGE